MVVWWCCGGGGVDDSSGGSSTDGCVQQSQVSSSEPGPSILASNVIGPLLLEVCSFLSTRHWFDNNYNNNKQICIAPVVLWRCWLGGRKGIRPVKTWVVICLEQVQTCIGPSGCHCHSLSLASVKSILVLPFWCRLIRVVLDKGLLNGCVFILCYSASHTVVTSEALSVK